MIKKINLTIIILFLFLGTSFATENQKQTINDVYVIHFILDGLNFKTFKKALNSGLMPTVKGQIIDGGAYFKESLSLFPTTSTTVYQSYTTGLLPGHSGIPHLERFDRQREKIIGYLSASQHAMINTDLINLRALENPEVVEIEPPTTIFELLKGYPTAAVYSSFYRGASLVYPKVAPIAALWSTYVSDNKQHVDVLAYRQLIKLFNKKESEIPRYTIAGLYSVDILGHSYGPSSPEVSEVLFQFDLFLRDFLKLLEKRQLLDKTYIIISADHGMHESGDLFALQAVLEDSGVSVKSKNPRKKDYSLYVANRGVASSHIYVKHDGKLDPMTDPEILRRIPTVDGKTVDLIDLIIKMEATDLLIVRNGDSKVDVYDHDGNGAHISCYVVDQTHFCSYKTDPKTKDPLGYSSNPKLKKLLDGKPHSGFEWMSLTAREHYPNAVFGFSQIFEDGRAGDIFITTREKFGFRKVKSGNHGGAGEDDMRVSLMIRGPTVPKGEFGAASAIDIYPLLLEWFGLNVHRNNYDGENPFNRENKKGTAIETLAAAEQMMDEGTSPAGLIKNKGLTDIAIKEKKARELLSDKLKNYLSFFEERTDKNDPYYNDHVDIIKRVLASTELSAQRMDRVVKAGIKRK